MEIVKPYFIMLLFNIIIYIVSKKDRTAQRVRERLLGTSIIAVCIAIIVAYLMGGK